MTRKIIDCRLSPSVANCTLTITGAAAEVLAAAAQHAISVHGHTDGPELHELLRGALADEPAGASQDGAFVQLFEFNTDRIEELDGIQDRFVDAMGNQRMTRWSIVGADRDRPQTYVAIVEFPNYERAMANSDNPVTGQFVKELREICTDEPQFRNLDVHRARPY
jgi:hypothetical protein